MSNCSRVGLRRPTTSRAKRGKEAGAGRRGREAYRPPRPPRRWEVALRLGREPSKCWDSDVTHYQACSFRVSGLRFGYGLCLVALHPRVVQRNCELETQLLWRLRRLADYCLGLLAICKHQETSLLALSSSPLLLYTPYCIDSNNFADPLQSGLPFYHRLHLSLIETRR